MNKMELTLQQDAYAANGVLRKIEDGQETIYVLRDWYEALATDSDDNEYMIYWSILDGYQLGDDESGACDWDNPYMVLRLDDNHDINNYVVNPVYTHPLDCLLAEFSMTRYALSKHGITQGASSNIVNRKTKIDNLTVETLVKLANALDLGLEETYARLKGYEN